MNQREDRVITQLHTAALDKLLAAENQPAGERLAAKRDILKTALRLAYRFGASANQFASKDEAEGFLQAEVLDFPQTKLTVVK